jgi:hypothetical protein
MLLFIDFLSANLTQGAATPHKNKNKKSFSLPVTDLQPLFPLSLSPLTTILHLSLLTENTSLHPSILSHRETEGNHTQTALSLPFSATDRSLKLTTHGLLPPSVIFLFLP